MIGPWEVLVIIVLWLLPIYVSHQIGKRKHRYGAFWGVFLGWIGVLVLALLPTRGKRCPWCAETVNPDALVCRFCGRELDPRAAAIRA